MSGQLNRVLLAGGGTAGHVMPLLSVAHLLRDSGAGVSIVGTAEGLESDLIPRYGFELLTLPRVPFPRRPGMAALRFPARITAALRRAKELIEQTRPEAIIGFGGYVSAPVYIAARRLGVPVLIHEQNAKPGMANRLGARSAAAVALTFPGTKLSARHGITEVTGLPLKPEIKALAEACVQQRQQARTAACRHFGLDDQLPVLLITGGSLGAAHLNEVVCAAAGAIPQTLNVIHVCGRGKAADVQQVFAGRDNYLVLEYLNEMELALAAADTMVCRAGAATVSENCALALPALYVPLAIGNGEQALNAAAAVSAGGALLVSNADFGPENVRDVVEILLDGERIANMSRALEPLRRADADEQIVSLLGRLVNGADAK